MSTFKLLITIATGLSFALCLAVGCKRESVEPPAAPTVVQLAIITPHGPAIQEAFADGFRRWQEARKLDEIITVQWMHMGTLECQRRIHALFEQYDGPSQPHSGMDIFFGGGVAVHRDIARRGYSQAIELPQQLRAELPGELNQQPLHASDGTWHGTALGGYGILFNQAACQARGIPVPTNWEDLARAEYGGWICIADPAASGSTTQCLVMLMLRHGWDRGWGILTGLLANCTGMLASSSMIAPNIAAGVGLAGLEPDFIARMTIAGAPQTLDYVSPSPTMNLSPDPISVLRGTPHLTEAIAFIEFVLSREGQALWALPADVPGGPPNQPLHRYPIRPDVYEQHKDQLVVKGNPFVDTTAMPFDAQLDRAYTLLLPHLIRAACGSQHIAMQQAYRMALSKGEQSKELAMLREPPFGSEQALQFADTLIQDPRAGERLEGEWAQIFAQRYQSVKGSAQ